MKQKQKVPISLFIPVLALNLRFSVKALPQPRWQRFILLTVLGYEAISALFGGGLLVLSPRGDMMQMPVSILHAVFSDFMIPGLVLFGLGILSAFAFILLLRNDRISWLVVLAALVGWLIWFIVEIAILRTLVWMHFALGLPVYLGCIVAFPLVPTGAMVKELLLFSGILSSLLYICMTALLPMQFPGYNSLSQTISELSAVDAPSRALWVWLSIIYTLLTIAFAIGVWKVAGNNRPLRIAGALMLAYGALGLLWPLAPMHLRETLAIGGGTLSDKIHIALAVASETLFVLALSFAAIALGKWFLYYSISTALVLLVFGFLTFKGAPNVGLNLPTPWLGLWERVNIGVFLLWIVVLATTLLRREKRDIVVKGEELKSSKFLVSQSQSNGSIRKKTRRL